MHSQNYGLVGILASHIQNENNSWHWSRIMFKWNDYMRNKEHLKEDYERISKYIVRKLQRRRFNRRPMELKYLHIAKATQSTYKQIRRVFDIMVEEGLIEKHLAWVQEPNKVYRRRNFYRVKIPV